jgi:hypothetical protein
MIGTTAILLAVLAPASTAGAAPAADGPPAVAGIAPQVAPISGGVPIRIYGSGFLGTTSVLFGGRPSPKFAVIDSNLITAIVAPASGGGAANNTFADVTVVDNEGSGTLPHGIYYTQAVLVARPSTGLAPGSPITASVFGDAPGAFGLLVEINPLLAYIEDPNSLPPGPPPYADLIGNGFTDARGNATVQTALNNPFNPSAQDFDPNATCPPTQVTANYLGNSFHTTLRATYSAKCILAFSRFGQANVETQISYSSDPVPAPPTLVLTPSSTPVGGTITLGGMFWNANPFFGSSTAANKPGETKVTVEICGLRGVAALCSRTTGSAAVELTRYINLQFSGAALSGTITVGPDVARGCTTCYVRVREYRPVGGFIEARAPLRVT